MTHDTNNPRLGFEEPIPMADPAPGTVDMTRLYDQYAAQVRMFESYANAAELANDGTAVVTTTHVTLK